MSKHCKVHCRFSQRWHSWTISMDIIFLRDRTVTFIARRVRSIAVRNSCINPGSELTLCSSLSELAWYTCRKAMACSAERWPVQLHCKPWLWVQPRTYRTWMGDTDVPPKWQHFVGTIAPQLHAPPVESPCTLWMPRHWEKWEWRKQWSGFWQKKRMPSMILWPPCAHPGKMALEWDAAVQHALPRDVPFIQPWRFLTQWGVSFEKVHFHNVPKVHYFLALILYLIY